MRPSHLVALTALISSAALAAEPAARPLPKPAPLAARPFTLPTTQSFTLKNGLRVVVARNDEVPIWDVRLAFNVGSYADPVGKEGLASVTLDMMDEGAGGLTVEEISKRLKLMGSSIGAAAEDDGAVVAASGLARHLEPTLDLWAKMITSPDFPEADWVVMQKGRVANLAAQREDPTAVASRVTRHVMWGEEYRGRLGSEAALRAITPADMKAFWTQNYGPKDAILLVGGAVDPKVIIPILEAKLGSWQPTTTPRTRPTPKPVASVTPVLYVVDKPGSAQSIIRVGQPIGDRTDTHYYALAVATEALGTFTGRLNMNLRESKGWTYGANCGARYGYGPGMWTCATSVRTDVTGPAIEETRKELSQVLGERPITAEEVGFRRSSDSLGFPLGFEQTGAILGEKVDIWRYGLPPDWTERYVPSIQKVNDASANEALRSNIRMKDLTWVVVGNLAVIRPSLDLLGLNIVVLDRDGNVVKGN